MNGKLQKSSSNQSGIQPLAGVKGTQILVHPPHTYKQRDSYCSLHARSHIYEINFIQVEDLFYNVPTRRKALTSKHEVRLNPILSFVIFTTCNLCMCLSMCVSLTVHLRAVS